MKIFISYARENKEFCTRLADALSERGYQVLIDEKNIEKLSDWWERIEQLIAQSDTVVFILSPAWAASPVCKDEIDYAAGLNKRFAPVVFQSVDDYEPPRAITRLNYVFFDDERQFDTAVSELVAALKADVGWLRDHTRIGEMAQRWESKGRIKTLLLHNPELRDAEVWLKRQPGSAPPATSLHREFIGMSRNAAVRRRRTWALIGIVAAAIFAQLAALTYFFRTDSQLNEVRFHLENNNIEAAQAALTALWQTPFATIVPPSSSARTVATNLLNGAIVEDLAGIRGPNGQSYLDQGTYIQHRQMLATHEAIYALFGDDQRQVLVRCNARVECETSLLESSLLGGQLVRDGELVDLVVFSSESKKGLRAPVPASGRLALQPVEMTPQTAPQLRISGDRVMWQGDDFIASIDNAGVISSSPPIVVTAEFAGPNIALFNPKIGESNDDGRSEVFDAEATCDDGLTLCVLAIADSEAAARSPPTMFNVWRFGQEEGDVSEGAHTWTEIINRLYVAPWNTLTSTAVTPDGGHLAISSDSTLHIWSAQTVSPRQRQPQQTIELKENVLALTFDEWGDLLVLTKDKLKRVRLAPRLIEHRPPTRGLPVAAENPSSGDEGLLSEKGQFPVVVSEDDGDVFVTAKAGAKRQQVFESPPGEKVTNTYWPKAHLLTVFNEARKATRLIALGAHSPAANVELGGRLVHVSDDATLAVSIRPDCRIMIVENLRVEHPIDFGGLLLNENCEEGLEVTAHERGARFITLIVRYGDTGSDRYRIAHIDASSAAFNIDVSDDDVRVIDFEGEDEDFDGELDGENFMYLTAKGEVVFFPAGTGLRPVRTAADATLQASLAAVSSDGPGIEAELLAEGIALLYVPDKSCPARSEGRSVGRLYLSRVSTSAIDAQFVVSCVDGLSSPAAFLPSHSASGKGWDRVFIGGYEMSGLIAWKPNTRALQVYHFVAKEALETVPVEKVIDLQVGDGEKPASIDLSAQSFEGSIGANAFEYSPVSQRLAFHRYRSGTPGQDHRVKLFDIKTQILRVAPNASREYFDAIEGVWLSPSAAIVLTKKEASGFELFRFEDARRLHMAATAEEAEFVSDTELSIKQPDGSVLLWKIPEGAGDEVHYAREVLFDMRAPQLHLPNSSRQPMPSQALAGATATAMPAEAKPAAVTAVSTARPVEVNSVPSFDCATNKAPDETAICSDAGLAAMDQKLMQLYVARMKERLEPDRAALRSEQKDWLKQRRACASDRDCLRGVYHSRLAQLSEAELTR